MDFPVTLDCDVLFGTWPPRAQVPMELNTVREKLDRSGVRGAVACSARGAWFDDVDGNTETMAALSAIPDWVPAATINLRNALRAEAELDRVVAAGVRAVRLFGPSQSCTPAFPGYQHVVQEAVRRGLVLLVEGDVRTVWSGFVDRGATVVFLDVHAYHLADFILAARREPGFIASTRLLNAPDSIETVAGDIGVQHLAYGSRTPLHATAPSLIRLRKARLSEAERAAVAGGTLKAALEKGSA